MCGTYLSTIPVGALSAIAAAIDSTPERMCHRQTQPWYRDWGLQKKVITETVIIIIAAFETTDGGIYMLVKSDSISFLM